jgi:hypothetical protein
MVGSPGWVSPEAYHGDEVGAPADVYGWGLLVCFAASGRPPHGVGGLEVLALRVMTQDPDTSAVPEDLRPLVERAVSRQVPDRPHAVELLETVANHWCVRRQEQPTGALADTTRLITRTWRADADAEPDWQVPVLAPRQSRRWLKIVLPAALALILAAVASFVLLNKGPTRSEIVGMASARLNGLFGLRFTAKTAKLTVTRTGFALGRFTDKDTESWMLGTPAGQYRRSTKDYWRAHPEALAEAAVWGDNTSLFDAAMKDFADAWMMTDWAVDLPKLFSGWKELTVAPFGGVLYGGAFHSATWSDVEIGGQSAIRIDIAGRLVSYVATRAPYRVLRVEAGSEVYDVTEIAGDPQAEVDRSLSQDAAERENAASALIFYEMGHEVDLVSRERSRPMPRSRCPKRGASAARNRAQPRSPSGHCRAWEMGTGSWASSTRSSTWATVRPNSASASGPAGPASSWSSTGTAAHGIRRRAP